MERDIDILITSKVSNKEFDIDAQQFVTLINIYQKHFLEGKSLSDEELEKIKVNIKEKNLDSY